MLMYILNLTPDSFWESSRAAGIGQASAMIAQMWAQGADIIDIGAVSTRPGAPDVGVLAEWERLEPVLRAIASGQIPTPEGPARAEIATEQPGRPTKQPASAEIAAEQPASPEIATEQPASAEAVAPLVLPRYSIDTTSAEIVRKCYSVLGAGFIVNDISAGEDDSAMLQTVAELGLPYIAMHKKGNPRTMDSLNEYPAGVVNAILDYFRDFEKKAKELGIKNWILDPGFGFAKDREQNLEILYNFKRLTELGRPVLAGLADKRFTRDSDGVNHTRDYEALCLEEGAAIIRTHMRSTATQNSTTGTVASDGIISNQDS